MWPELYVNWNSLTYGLSNICCTFVLTITVKHAHSDNREKCFPSYDTVASIPWKIKFPSQMPRSCALTVYLIICNYTSLLKP